MAKVVDFILEEDYARYNEILTEAEAAREAAPKVRKARAPMTQEQKLKAAQTRRDNAQAKLDALLAAEAEAENYEDD